MLVLLLSGCGWRPGFWKPDKAMEYYRTDARWDSSAGLKVSRRF